MFAPILNKYKVKGSFRFCLTQNYAEVCNAPIDQSGVYMIYKFVNDKEILVYIGSSGRKGKDGLIRHRKGGMKDRLTNGYHPNRFGEIKRIKRSVAFPKLMRRDGINEIKIYWWVTYEKDHRDFPTDIERLLISSYLDKFGDKPEWHQAE